MADVPITLEPYNESWPRWFRSDAENVRGVLGEALLELHHIGSTSVPGMVAKPIIDMLGVVVDLADLEPCRDAMEAVGYAWRGEGGIPGRRFFSTHQDDGAARHVHLHVFAVGDSRIDDHLMFCAYLRRYPAAAAEYAKFKAALCEQFADQRERYTDEKGPFIQSIVARAKQQHGP